MKFDAAAITPGRANVCQNGTEPSAKSIQSVPLPGIPQVPADACCGDPAKAAKAASAMTTSLLIDPSAQVSRSRGSPPAPGDSRSRATGGRRCDLPPIALLVQG